MLAGSPKPEAHEVLDNNPDRIGIWKFWFLRRGENRSTRRKTSRSRVENQQQTQPTYDAGSGNLTRDTLVGGGRSHHCRHFGSPINISTRKIHPALGLESSIQVLRKRHHFSVQKTFQQKLLSSSVIQYKAMEVEFIISRKC